MKEARLPVKPLSTGSGACPPPGTLRVVGVYSSSVNCGNRVFHKTAFIQRVGVYSHLYVEFVGSLHRGPNGAGVEPQSSWILKPQAPASTCSCKGFCTEQFPFPSKP